MEFRRDDAAEDLRRAAEVVDLEKRAAILGGRRKLPGPSLSEDMVISLSQLAIVAACGRSSRIEKEGKVRSRIDLDERWLVSPLTFTDAACFSKRR